MTEEPRYATLRDYLALLSRQRWVVVAVTVAISGAAFLLSASQEDRYLADAAVSFDDLTQELSFLGTNSPVVENSLQRAAKEAERMTRLDAARQVQDRLDTEVSPAALQAAVTTRVGVQTSFVEVTARWTDPELAAEIANQFSAVAIEEANSEDERVLDTLIKSLKDQAELGKLSAEELIVNPEALLARQQLVGLLPLQDTFKAATLARRAEVPTAPVAPKVARNTVIAAIVGLALGLLVAFIRDSLDRKIRTSRAAHDEFGFPVIGHLAASALGSAGQLANGGLSVTSLDLEASRILRTNLGILGADRPPRSVLVTSGLPQEGKSTVAVALAGASAAAGQRTLLVEADMRRPVVADRAGLKQGPGLADYLAGLAAPADILQTVPIQSRPTGNGRGAPAQSGRQLVVITAGTIPAEPAELLASDRCRDFLDKVSRTYDLVVIDSSPMLSTADPLELMPHVDGVLICVRLAASTNDEAKAVTGVVELLPPRPIGLVVTGVGPGEYSYYGYYSPSS